MTRRLVALVSIVLLALAVLVPPASAASFPASVPLPVDFQPEGIASGAGSTFYVGSLRTGDIYRGDLRTGEGAIFIDAPDGRAAVGLRADVPHHLLFVAGGATGAVYVYDLRTGAPVATYQFATPGQSLLNDVVVTSAGAFITDTFAPVLYKIAMSPSGALGQGSTLPLSGPAAQIVPGDFNLNGIAAPADGRTLIVNHTALGKLFTVNPVTGESADVAVDGILPGTPDGMLLAGHDLWLVENFANTLVRIEMAPDLSSGTITRMVTSPQFQVPTTVAKFGNRLAAVNGRFDLGFPPPFGPGAPAGTTFDVAVFSAS